jgi:glucokinase
MPEVTLRGCRERSQLLYDPVCDCRGRPACLYNCLQTAAQITTAALREDDEVAQEAVDMMMNIVGAEAGAMALRCLSKGEHWAGGWT